MTEAEEKYKLQHRQRAFSGMSVVAWDALLEVVREVEQESLLAAVEAVCPAREWQAGYATALVDLGAKLKEWRAMEPAG